MYRVLLVEDDPMARQLLEIYINNYPNYVLFQSIESAAMAEIHCMSGFVDVILMDVCTAMNVNGIEVAEKLKRNYPKIKIIVITSYPECSFIYKAKEACVDSFWYKSATAEEILSIMDRTMNGERIYPDEFPVVKLGEDTSDSFSKRELEVLRYIVEGETDAAIAEKLFITVSAVKYHIQNMKNRTGFRNRTELAVRARESGIVIGEIKKTNKRSK